MLSYLKIQQPTTLLLLIGLFLAAQMPASLTSIHLLSNTTQLQPTLWSNLSWIQNIPPFVQVLIAMAIVFFQAVWFNYLFNKAKLNEHISFIPALYYSFFMAVLHFPCVLTLPLLANFLLLGILHLLIRLQHNTLTKTTSFNIGCLLGIACCLYTPILIFVPLFIIGLVLIYAISFTFFLLLLIGIIFPFYLTGSILYLMPNAFVDLAAVTFTTTNFYNLKQQPTFLVALGFIAIYLVFSFVQIRGILFSAGHKRKQSTQVIVLYLIGGAFITAFNIPKQYPNFIFFATPVACFLALLMLRIYKKNRGEVLNAIFVLLTLIINWFRYFTL